MAELDFDTFQKRFNILQKWLNTEKSEGLLVIYGKDDGAYSKSMALHQWLFGISLINTAVFFKEKNLILLANRKVQSYLKSIFQNKEFTIDFIERSKADDDKESITKFKTKISSFNLKIIGHLAKDKFEGKFFEFVKNYIKELSDVSFEDVSSSLSLVFAVKDTEEIAKIRKACTTTVDVYRKELKELILKTLDSGDKLSHADISANTEKHVQKIAKVDLDSLEICYPPIIQSGGKFNLKFSIESDTSNLHPSVIICSMGLRYDFYCSNVIRTLMINATSKQKELYEYLTTTLYVYAVEHIKPGKTFGEVAGLIEKKFKGDKADLSDNLLASFGFSTGAEFKDKFLTIQKNCSVQIKKNMCIIFYIGIQNIDNKDATDRRAKTYSIWIGDTLLIGGADGSTNENPELEIGGNIILTGGAKKRNKENLYKLTDDKEEDVSSSKPLVDLENYGRGQRRAVAQADKQKEDESNETKRKEHQGQLFDRLLKESEKRLLGIRSTDDNVAKKRTYISYKSKNNLPKEESMYNYQMHIDKRNHTVMVHPSGGVSPFHLSIIKNASLTEEGDKVFLRFNLHPKGGSVTGKTNVADEDTLDVYIKEMTFKTANMKLSNSHTNNAALMSNIFHTFKEEQRRYKQAETQAQENADLVAQDTLKLNGKRDVPKLKDLYIRPTISKQRITGNLECHDNGFRFVSIKGENIDILFNNVKHAFFQPCDHEMIVLIHFHLKNPIMYCKKKQKDIQFYTEVGELTADLGKMNHMHDRDDLESEQREKEMRRKINDAFLRFCTRVNEINELIDFDQPIRNLGFMGCPVRSTVLLQPTTACLVQLTEWPPFVVTMDDLELIFFERVNLSNKSFDMVIIFKDYNEKPVTICSLPQEKLDDVKNWLNHIEVYYSEGGKSLNWMKIMKNITDDPQKFLEDGGWSALCGESDAEEDDEDMDEDEKYTPSGSEDDGGSDESDSEAEGNVEGEESNWEDEVDNESAGGELGSDESEGMDWDDLEEEARRADNDTEVVGPPQKKRRF